MTPTELELYQYIEENRPEMLLDREDLLSLIRLRSEASGSEYETQVQSGVDPLTAQEMAHQVLYADLNFCPCQLIDEVIEKNYRVTAHSSILVSCFRAVKEIFDEYPSTDEFYLSADCERLSDRIEMPVVQYLRHWALEDKLETGVH